MDAAPELDRFAEVPYVIEAPASQGGMLGAAAALLAKRGIRVSFDDSRGLAPEKYRAIVESVRRDIQASLTPKSKYAVAIYDPSTPDPAAEMGKIDRSFRGFGAMIRGVSDNRGAFSSGFKAPNGGIHCVAVGFKPDFDVERSISGGTGGRPVPRVGLDDGLFHRMSLLHEVGHCLLGGSEAKADAFAVLMALRDPAIPRSALALWASWRENAEWTFPVTDDDHFTAKPVWAVLERAESLVADPQFMGMKMEGVAGVANAIVEDRGMSLDEEAETASVRRAIRGGVMAITRQPDGRDGASLMQVWLKLHQDVPEARRILEIRANMVEGAKPMRPFEHRPGSFRNAIGELAANGDAVAEAMVRAYDAKPDPNSPAAQASASMHTAAAVLGSQYASKRTDYETKVAARLGHALEAHADEPEPGPAMGR